MGRPPKQNGRKVKSQTLWIYPDAMWRVLKHAGKREVSRFVRDAIDEKLDREGARPYDPIEAIFDDPEPANLRVSAVPKVAVRE